MVSGEEEASDDGGDSESYDDEDDEDDDEDEDDEEDAPPLPCPVHGCSAEHEDHSLPQLPPAGNSNQPLHIGAGVSARALFSFRLVF